MATFLYESYYGVLPIQTDVIKHYQVKGAKHGVRRWQNYDGSLTPAGRVHYGVGEARDGAHSAHNKAKTDIDGDSGRYPRGQGHNLLRAAKKAGYTDDQMEEMRMRMIEDTPGNMVRVPSDREVERALNKERRQQEKAEAKAAKAEKKINDIVESGNMELVKKNASKLSADQLKKAMAKADLVNQMKDTLNSRAKAAADAKAAAKAEKKLARSERLAKLAESAAKLSEFSYKAADFRNKLSLTLKEGSLKGKQFELDKLTLQKKIKDINNEDWEKAQKRADEKEEKRYQRQKEAEEREYKRAKEWEDRLDKRRDKDFENQMKVNEFNEKARQSRLDREDKRFQDNFERGLKLQEANNKAAQANQERRDKIDERNYQRQQKSIDRSIERFDKTEQRNYERAQAKDQRDYDRAKSDSRYKAFEKYFKKADGDTDAKTRAATAAANAASDDEEKRKKKQQGKGS